jgi:stearoyl-CoA desaturase (delta-9 desaturase)
MDINLNTKIRLIQLVNLILGCWAIVAAIQNNEAVYLALSYAMGMILGPIFIGAGMHRLFCHKAYITNNFWQRLLAVGSVYSTVGSSISWVGLHRTHHAYSDTIKDPHTPGNGILRTIFGYGWKSTTIPISYVKELYQNTLHLFLHQNYFKVLLIPVIGCMIIDPYHTALFYCLPATIALQSYNMLNILGHGHGYQTHQTGDFSTNSWIAAIFTLGEGWHNNHHKHAAGWTTKEQWWEIDVVGWFIRAIRV